MTSDPRYFLSSGSLEFGSVADLFGNPVLAPHSVNLTRGHSLIVPPCRIGLQPWGPRIGSRRATQSPDLYLGLVT